MFRIALLLGSRKSRSALVTSALVTVPHFCSELSLPHLRASPRDTPAITPWYTRKQPAQRLQSSRSLFGTSVARSHSVREGGVT